MVALAQDHHQTAPSASLKNATVIVTELLDQTSHKVCTSMTHVHRGVDSLCEWDVHKAALLHINFTVAGFVGSGVGTVQLLAFRELHFCRIPSMSYHANPFYFSLFSHFSFFFSLSCSFSVAAFFIRGNITRPRFRYGK